MFEVILLLSEMMNTGVLRSMGYLYSDIKCWAASKLYAFIGDKNFSMQKKDSADEIILFLWQSKVRQLLCELDIILTLH